MLDLIFLAIFGFSLLAIFTFFIWEKLDFSWLNNIAFCLVLSLPFERVPSLEMSGVNIRISQILVLLGFYFLAILLIKKDDQLLQTQINKVTWWIFAFWVSLLPSLFFAINGQRQIQVLIATILVFGATFLISHFLKNILETAKYLVLVLSGVGIFGLYQFVADFVGVPYTITLLREHYTKRVFGFARIHATALEPLYWGGMLLFPCVFLILYLILKQDLKTKIGSKIEVYFHSKWLLLAAFSVLGLNLILTLSRGAYLAFGATTLVALVLSFKNFSWKSISVYLAPYFLFITILGVGFIGFSGDTTLIDKVSDHILNVFSDKQFSTYERLNFLSGALDLIYQNTIVGIGSGNYGPAVQNNIPQGDGGWLIVNNVYVEIWLEQGLLALLIFVTFLLYYIFQGLKYYFELLKNRESGDLHDRLILVLALISSLIGYMLQWLTFSPIFIMPVFILLGLLIALIRDKKLE